MEEADIFSLDSYSLHLNDWALADPTGELCMNISPVKQKRQLISTAEVEL